VVINEQLDYAEDVTPLSAEESLLLLDIQQAMSQFSSIESRPKLWRIQFSKVKMKSIIDSTNTVVEHIPTSNISETDALLYSVAYVITTHFTKAVPPKIFTSSIPPWKTRLMNKVSQLRKEVSQLVSANDASSPSVLCERLKHKYWVNERGLLTAIEDAKQRLLSTSSRLNRYTTRCDQYKQNKMFRETLGHLYN